MKKREGSETESSYFTSWVVGDTEGAAGSVGTLGRQCGSTSAPDWQKDGSISATDLLRDQGSVLRLPRLFLFLLPWEVNWKKRYNTAIPKGHRKARTRSGRRFQSWTHMKRHSVEYKAHRKKTWASCTNQTFWARENEGMLIFGGGKGSLQALLRGSGPQPPVIEKSMGSSLQYTDGGGNIARTLQWYLGHLGGAGGHCRPISHPQSSLALGRVGEPYGMLEIEPSWLCVRQKPPKLCYRYGPRICFLHNDPKLLGLWRASACALVLELRVIQLRRSSGNLAKPPAAPGWLSQEGQ